jgi:hypothetical protein
MTPEKNICYTSGKKLHLERHGPLLMTLGPLPDCSTKNQPGQGAIKSPETRERCDIIMRIYNTSFSLPDK